MFETDGGGRGMKRNLRHVDAVVRVVEGEAGDGDG